MRGRKQLNQQLIAALLVIGVLLIGAALILGDDLPLVGTAGETEEPPPPPDGDGDGFADPDDACPGQGDAGFGIDGSGCPNPPPDADSDGITDADDACPNDANHDSVGDPCNHDEDGDGVDDFSDACATQGDAGNGVDGSGCPNPPPATDSDGDGVNDDIDACVDQGDQGNGVDETGCPNPPPATDSDGDGVNDDVDACVDQGDQGNGVDETGCPNPPPVIDTDGDGVNDDVDTCPEEGDAGNGVDETGCPIEPTELAVDSDGDGVNDDVDACIDEGDAGNGVDETGCPIEPTEPAVDSDGDGVNDDVDACPEEGDAGFGVDASGCPNEEPVEVAGATLNVAFDATITDDTVQFTDTSSVGEDDTMTGWSWNFGDGGSSGDQNPSYTYASPGTYTVELTVTTANGQTGSVQGSVTIEEATEVVCNFEAVQLNDELPLQVQFNNLSSNVASYGWDFGNGQTSSDAGPHTITYDTAGDYAITLTCTDESGGTLTANGSVTAEESTEPTVELTASFNVDVNSGAAPLTVTFTDTSVSSESDPIASYSWSFGESGQGPHTVVYDTPGVYDVTLTVTTESGATATASGTITVEGTSEEPAVSINASPLVGEAPLTVTFSGNSTGGEITTWTWSTGDTGQGPHSVTYDTAGSYTIRVDVEGPGGSAFATQEIRVTEGGAQVESIFSFSIQTPTEEGFPVCFTNASTGEIATYSWNFGDGSGTSNEESPCYTYAAEGQYIVDLTVVGVNSDEQSSAQQVVSIVPGLEAPVADFTANRTTLEVGQQVFLNNQSTGIINTYEWSFGDGGTSSAENPSHTYTEAGDYIISLRVTGPGGTSEAAEVAISVIVPEVSCSINGSGNVGFNLTGNYSADVDNAGDGEITYRWTLDGEEVSTTDSFSQLFSTPGSYNLVLEVSIDGEVACNTSRTINVSEDNFSCDFNGDRSARLNQTVTYRERNVRNLNDREIVSQVWTLDGAEVGTGSSFRFQWTTPGTYSLTYTITLENGANCSRTRTVTVSEEIVECSISGNSRVDLYESRNYRANIAGLVDGQNVTGYSWSNGGTERTSAYRFGTVGEGQVTIEVTIFYGEGESCVVSRTIRIRNGGQDRLSCDFNGDTSALLTETIGYGGSVNNLEDRTATYSWTVDGQEVGTDRNLTYQWTTAGEFNLTFTVTPSEGEPCSRSRTVSVSEETLVCRINGNGSPIIGEEYRYTSNVDGLSGRTPSYSWSIDGVEVSTSRNLNYTFEATGSATVSLSITTDEEGVSCSASRSLEVQAGQSINAIATPNAGIAPLYVTFTAETNNIDRSTLTWHYPGGSTQRAETGSFLFSTPGQYTVTVIGEGPLGEQEASVVVNVGGNNVIRAAFQPNPFSGLAPLQVCFTDQSQGDEINSWSWDFGNGQTSTEQNPCTTYDTPGSWSVRLQITNVYGLQAFATNIVRTYEVGSSSGSIGITVNPGREVCFSSEFTEGVTWDFGDGTTSNEANPCHTYNEDGTFTVALTVEGSSSPLVRQVSVQGELLGCQKNNPDRLDCSSLAVTGVCEQGVAVFTIRNTGEAGDGDMRAPTEWRLYVDDVLVDSGQVLLGGAETMEITYDGPGSVRLEADQQIGHPGNSRPRETVSCGGSEGEPELDVSGVCNEDGSLTFTFTNSGADMENGVPYTITAGDETLDSGTTNALETGGSQSFTVNATNDGQTVTFSAEGLEESVAIESCYTSPSLSVSGVCNEDGTVTFTFTNDGGDMPEGVAYSITADNETLDSGTTNALENGGSQSFTVDATTSGQTITFSAEGLEEPVSVTSCYAAPELSASGVCNEDGTVTFTFTNNGGLMSEGANYSITAGNETLDSGTTNALANGGSQSFTVSATPDGQTITFSADGLEEPVSVESCYTPPNLSVSGVCNEDGTVTFTLTNDGGLMSEGADYSISAGDQTLDSGTSDALANGGSQSFTVNATDDGETITFSAEGLEEPVSVTSCYTPPSLTASGVCNEDGTVTFTLTNNGGLMDEGSDYSISAGDQTLDSGTSNILANGGSQSFTVSATPDGQTITFTAESLEEPVSVESCATPPGLSVNGVCNNDGTVTFTLSNSGGVMDAGTEYTITAGNETLDSGTTNALANNGSQSFTVDATNDGQTITFSAEGLEEPVSVENCYAPPSLTASGVCNEDGTVSFTLTNEGGLMSDGVVYSIATSNETLERGTTDALANGGSQTFTVDATPVGQTITFSAEGLEEPVSVENCYAPPSLTASGVCNEDGTVSFTLTNEGGPMDTGTSYTITAGNETLDSGTSDALTNGGSQSFTVDATSDGQTITFAAEGLEEPVSVENCYAPPSLAASGVCNEDGTVSFTLTNESGPMDTGTSYTITAGNETLDSGTSDALANGGSQTFTVEATPVGQTITFAAEGLEEPVSVESCYAPPSPSVSGVCNEDGTVSFTLTNVGGPMDTGINYTITAGEETVDSGTSNTLDNAGSQTFTVNATSDGQTITFSSEALEESVSVESCYAPPSLEVTGVCNEDGTVSFTLTNVGGPMDEGVDYTIVTGEVTVESGTSDALSNGGSQSFTVDATDDGQTVTFNIEALEVSVSVESCYTPPNLVASAVCDSSSGESTFTVENIGGRMLEETVWQVTDAEGNVVDSGTFQLNEDETFSHTVTDVVGTLNFAVDSFELYVSTICFEDANLALAGYCNANGSATFTITNNGGDMALSDQSVAYSVVNADNVVIVENAAAVLGAGETLPITVENVTDAVSLTLNFEGQSATTSVANCVEIPPETPEPPDEICGGVSLTGQYGFPVIDMDPSNCTDTPLTPAPWNPVEVGEGVCVDWLIYHTNQTGDWEIFRLGGDDLFPGTSNNLSEGVGTRIIDLAPSRAPDAQWVTFASNRDGNFEIYLASVGNIGPDGGRIYQRMTWNSRAVDIDPVWSPGGAHDGGMLIVYESSRNGKWDLYMFNVMTGEEQQLTDDPDNDINAFWAPDGSKLVFQSDRSGMWQIYELDLTNFDEDGLPTETLLSDGSGDDLDPQYSNEGDRIAFRSTRDGDNGVIYVMNADGSDVMAISDPDGNASNHIWSPDDSVIAYQSDLDGDNDIYVYQFPTEDEEEGQTRLVTDNEIDDYAPTWFCESTQVVFSSDVDNTEENPTNPNLFTTNALPIDADPIIVDEEADRLTSEPDVDYYPQNSPSEENASRQGSLP